MGLHSLNDKISVSGLMLKVKGWGELLYDLFDYLLNLSHSFLLISI